jgi:hypothetical protein
VGLRWISGGFFPAVVEWGFYRGFCEKLGAACGAFVVNLWWSAWQTWGINCSFLRFAEWDRFVKFIFGRTQKNDNLPLDLGST